jgi:hypothetical protein
LGLGWGTRPLRCLGWSALPQRHEKLSPSAKGSPHKAEDRQS